MRVCHCTFPGGTATINKILCASKKNLVNKCLEASAEIAEKKDDEQYDMYLTLGARKDLSSSTKVAELMCYHTFQFGDEQSTTNE